MRRRGEGKWGDRRGEEGEGRKGRGSVGTNKLIEICFE